MIECYAIAFLLIATNIFWASVCLGLTNRLMSRNFAEFTQVTAKPTRLKPVIEEDGFDPHAERQAKDLNSMLGMV